MKCFQRFIICQEKEITIFKSADGRIFCCFCVFRSQRLPARELEQIEWNTILVHKTGVFPKPLLRKKRFQILGDHAQAINHLVLFHQAHIYDVPLSLSKFCNMLRYGDFPFPDGTVKYRHPEN